MGFIGSNLARRLVDLGAKVSLVDCLAPDGGGNRFNISGIEERVSVTVADIRDEEGMSELIPEKDFLFNLAGQTSHVGSMQDPRADLEVNGLAQLMLLELCRKLNPGLRIVYAGTRQVYGRPRALPVSEDHPLAPIDYNSVSKLAGEWYHSIGHAVYGLRTTSLRMTNVYGPRMRTKDARQTFIGGWIRQAIEGGELAVYGDGRQVRDLNYVDDVVEALLLAAADPAAVGETYNLGGDEPINLLDLAHMLVEINASGSCHLVPFPAERKPIDIGDYTGDFTKIRTHLGWSPQTRLWDGLALTLDYYSRNRAHYW
jgi:UDP-glucose 4-epimerase